MTKQQREESVATNMADSRFSSYFYLFCITILLPTCCHCHLRSPDDHVPLFIFGDSIFDPGNNNYLKNAGGTANFWPYGETFFKHPTGRFSDGRIIPDFIAGYLKLPLIPPYLQPGDHQFTDGANFASGGAGVLDETLPGMVINLRTQLSYFRKVEKQLRQKKPGVAETKLLLSKAIYLFSIGINDYMVPFVSNSTVLQSRSKEEAYVGTVIGNLTAVIEEIYKIGGRKFGFLNAGPFGCSPYIRSMKQLTRGCADELTTLEKLHNREFSKALKHLQIQLEGFRYTSFDFYKSLTERMNHPSKYGFKEGKEACCGSGLYRGTIPSCGWGSPKEFQLCQNASEYVFFDGAHPTDNANNQYADLMWGGSADFTKPCNLKTLVET